MISFRESKKNTGKKEKPYNQKMAARRSRRRERKSRVMPAADALSPVRQSAKPHTASIDASEQEALKMEKPVADMATGSLLPPVQRKAETGALHPSVAGKIDSHKPGGKPLDDSTRRLMESSFGENFKEIKVHDDKAAGALAQAFQARAFTSGNHIFFNEGGYRPDNAAGKALLAHELAHTVQQGGDTGKMVQKKEMAFDADLIAVQLRNAMEGLGTDEAAIYAAMAGRTDAQVTLIAEAYLKLTGRGLQADLEDELTRSELLALAQYSQVLGDTAGHRATAVAMQLRDAMEGWGTDENAIYVALQGRSTDELEKIGAAYLELTGHKLMDDLKDELTDDEMNIARGTMGLAPEVTEKNTELGMLSMGNFDFSFSACKIDVEVRVKFQFTSDIAEADRQAFKPRFIDAVHQKWQHSGYKLVGGPSCPCEEVPITITVKEDQSDYHKIVDVEDKTDEQRRPMVVSDINVNLHTDDETFMHEFGHVLGLYDEYDGGFFENIMFWHKNRPDDAGSLMNELNPDGTENFERGLRPRFFEHYRKKVNETAPMNCNYIITH